MIQPHFAVGEFFIRIVHRKVYLIVVARSFAAGVHYRLYSFTIRLTAKPPPREGAEPPLQKCFEFFV